MHGENDEFGDVGQVRKLAADLEKNTTVRLVVVPGAGHFFDDSLDELKRVITEWTRELYA